MSHSYFSSSEESLPQIAESIRIQRESLPSAPSSMESLPHSKYSPVSPEFREIGYDGDLTDQTFMPYSPYKLSARINQVIDDALIPSPLHSRSSKASTRSITPSSSLLSYSSNGLNSQRDPSQYYRKQKQHDLPTTLITEQRPKQVDQTPHRMSKHWKYRLSSIAQDHRSNLQHEISNMYDTLTSITITPSKHKPSSSTSSAVKMKPRTNPAERRTPAIPLSPYQHLGAKVWEEPSKRSRSSEAPGSKSNTRRSFPLSSLFRSDATMEKSKKMTARESESKRRRAELKKRIVMIGVADQFPDGRVNRWV
ncbi:hypothetical protein MMC25_000182 [Agyrium rufum]|nr:hypothetical protein [Agyrium rufum]